jgi:hypothetical protein
VTERKMKWLGAGAVTLLALVVYTLTMAPTVSFWDCGEYISAARTFAVPHPPGAAAHHLVGRLGIMLFGWFSDLGERTNWLSAIFSALTAGAAYLTAFRAIQMFQAKTERSAYLWVAGLGGLLAGSLTTFGDTFWFSAVETEVYNFAMFFTLAGVWLMLEWTDLRGTPWGDRILVLVVYLSFFSTNFTLFTVMFLPIISIWMVIVDSRLRSFWSLYIVGPLVMSILYMAGDFPFITLATIVVSGVLWAVFRTTDRGSTNHQGWKLGTMISVAALVGWSIFFYIPIRSTLDPIIDEGDPEIRKPLVVGDPSTYDNLKRKPTLAEVFDLDNWGEVKEYIERKQYGSENPITRAMTRRSNPLNQLFVHENMGYGGYMFGQFLPFKVGRDESVFGIRVPSQVAAVGVAAVKDETGMYHDAPNSGAKRLAQLAMFLLAHMPLWWLVRWGWKRDKFLAGFLAALYIFASFGILWYVNFADGTRPELSDLRYYLESKAQGQQMDYPAPVHMEVRERDYFFTPAFVMLSVLYGMAFALYLQAVRQRSESTPWKKSPKFLVLLVLSLLSPVVAGFSNWHEHNRSKNWVPFDYAFNLLNSCAPNGILFTNGDNDTFPLWALQEVYDIRKDVRLVNLSLINTDWYIRQMRDIEPKVPIEMSDALIRQLEPERNSIPKGAAIQVGPRVVAFPSSQELPYIKIQDRMIIHIVMTNDKLGARRKPVHFAATVGEENMLGLAPYCRMEGMVFTLTDSIQNDPVDIDRTTELFNKVYRFRGMAGDKYSSGYLDDDTRRLESNYTSIAIQAAMGSAEGIRRQLDSASLPGLTDSVKARCAVTANGRVAKVVELIRRADQLVPTEWRTAYFGAQLFAQLDRKESADSVLAVARKRLPDEPMLLRAQAEVYQRTGRLDKAASLLDSAAVKSPKDAQLRLDAAMLLSEIGRNEEALKHVEQALKLAPADQRAQAIAQQIQMRIQAQPKGLSAPQVVAPAPNQAPVASPAKPVDSAKPAKKIDSAKK